MVYTNENDNCLGHEYQAYQRASALVVVDLGIRNQPVHMKKATLRKSTMMTSNAGILEGETDVKEGLCWEGVRTRDKLGSKAGGLK